MTTADHPHSARTIGSDELHGHFAIRMAEKRAAITASIDAEIARLVEMKSRVQAVSPEIVLAAIDQLGSPSGAARWLTRPEILLGDRCPLDVAGTRDGNQSVLKALERIG